MHLFIRFLPLVFLSAQMSCVPSKQQVVIHQLPNYDSKAVHSVLFLDFTIRRNTLSQPEQVTLTNSIMGNGEMKPIGRSVHTPYQLLIRYYTKGNPAPETDSLEHPLFRSIEIANTNGTFDRTLTKDQEGHFSIRFPYSRALTKLEVYSRTPDQAPRKIYTLSLKP